METLTYGFIVGRPDGVLTTLRRKVAQLARNVGDFKVGKTSDPSARARQRDYASYDEMIVIYKTPYIDDMNEVERELIAHFSAHNDNQNFRGGGGGPIGQPPYYVYVVRSRALLTNLDQPRELLPVQVM